MERNIDLYPKQCHKINFKLTKELNVKIEIIKKIGKMMDDTKATINPHNNVNTILNIYCQLKEASPSRLYTVDST